MKADIIAFHSIICCHDAVWAGQKRVELLPQVELKVLGKHAVSELEVYVIREMRGSTELLRVHGIFGINTHLQTD